MSTGQAWTTREHRIMHTMLSNGLPYQFIADRLGRSHASVKGRAAWAGVRQATSTDLLTIRQVKDIFGIKSNLTVPRWIERVWLHPNNGTVYRFDMLDVLAMIENPDTWYGWDPHKLTDDDTRAWALECRANGPRWLTTADIAAQLHVSPDTVVTWINNGLLPASKYGRVFYVLESDVAAFVPPCERQQ